MKKRVFMLTLFCCGMYMSCVYSSETSLKEVSSRNESWSLVAANGDLEGSVFYSEPSSSASITQKRKSPIVWKIGDDSSDDLLIDASQVPSLTEQERSSLRRRRLVTSEDNNTVQDGDASFEEVQCINFEPFKTMVKREIVLTVAECKEDLLWLWAGVKSVGARIKETLEE